MAKRTCNLEQIYYTYPNSTDTIPQLDSAQIMDYIQAKGDTFHMMYLYQGFCPGCSDILPEFMSFVKQEKIPYSIMIVERAADEKLVHRAINNICNITQFVPPMIILSDSLYEEKYRYSKPQSERKSLFITYGHHRKGDCNKYYCYLEKCVPDFEGIWYPRILLYHVNRGVIYDAMHPSIYEREDVGGPSITEKEKQIMLNLIRKR
ncbi:MAG: hypothetical protein IJQ95_00475 [Paludibacteraceae bacterium]|nr:hypothetical protein [Paludibacteraceae bacterium]